MPEIYSALLGAMNKWDDFGLALNIGPSEIDNIEENYMNNQKRLRKMLTYWLESSPSRTWTDICKALRSSTVQLNALAQDIEKKYCNTGKLL